MAQGRLLGIGIGALAIAIGIAAIVRSGDEGLAADESSVESADTQVPDTQVKRKAISADKLRELSPKVMVTPKGERVLLGPARDENGETHARIPELDDMLEEEGVDDARSGELLVKLREVVPESAQLSALDVACSESFCRVTMVKPVKTETLWDDIGVSIQMLTPGEKFFLTENEGETTTGYVYFSGDEGVLPLATLHRPDEGEGT